jgi:hypothetical protein
MNRMWLNLVAAVVLLGTTPLAAADLEIAPLKYLVGPKAPNAWIPFASSHRPSAEPDKSIKRIMLSIHSSDYNALQYLNNAQVSAAKVPGAVNETLVIAPQFFEKKVVPGSIPQGMLYWRIAPYRGSGLAAVGPAEQKCSLSAFEVIDNMLAQLVNTTVFPNLEQVVLVGHSAGGQLVQRYAMVGKFEPAGGIGIRFVVSAPSSFAYPTAERLVPNSAGQFAVPSPARLMACPDYNNWGYGLNKPFGYFKDANPRQIAQRYGQRQVYYLCGAKDSNADDGSTSTTCGAMMQGRHRRERTEVFYAYLLHTYGKEISQHQKMAITANVGHYGLGNMSSPAGLRFLFADAP